MKSHPLALSGAEGTALSAVEGPGPAARSDGRVRYSAAVVARVREMARVGAWPADAAGVGTGEAGSLAEGTFVRVQVRPSGQGREAVYKVFGCSAAIAAASLVTEWIERGRALAAADVATALELPRERAYVAQLAVEAAEKALGASGASTLEGTTSVVRERTAKSERRTAKSGQRRAKSGHDRDH